jgi:DNA primase
LVVFDADAAGRAAALRSLSIFLDEGMAARVMVLPQNEDPDSFVNKHGLDAFRDLMDRSVPVFDFYMDQKLAEGALGGRPVSTMNGGSVLAERTMRRVSLLETLSEDSGSPEAVVLAEVQTNGRPTWRGDRQDLKERLGQREARNGQSLSPRPVGPPSSHGEGEPEQLQERFFPTRMPRDLRSHGETIRKRGGEYPQVPRKLWRNCAGETARASRR